MAQQEWIVWGRRDDHASGQWIKLAGGTLYGCAREGLFRLAQGWETRLRTPGRPALDAGDLADVDVDVWAEPQDTYETEDEYADAREDLGPDASADTVRWLVEQRAHIAQAEIEAGR